MVQKSGSIPLIFIMEAEEIREARILLRELHQKYMDELFRIVNKIDEGLGKLENNKLEGGDS